MCMPRPNITNLHSESNGKELHYTRCRIISRHAAHGSRLGKSPSMGGDGDFKSPCGDLDGDFILSVCKAYQFSDIGFRV